MSRILSIKNTITLSINKCCVNFDVEPWKAFKIRSMVGYFNGVFPVQNLFFSSSVHDIKFQIFSTPYFISWILFILKLFGLGQILGAIHQLNIAVEFEQTYIDMLSFMVTVLTSFGLGIFKHVLNIININDFLEAAQATAKFRKKYFSLGYEKINYQTGYSNLNHVFSLYFTLTLPFAFWKICSSYDTLELFKGELNLLIYPFELGSAKHLYIFVFYCTFVLAFLEVASIYLFGSLFCFAEVMITTLDGILNQMHQKLNRISNISFIMQGTLNDKKQFQDSQVNLNWNQLSKCYLDFLELFAKYEKYASAKLISLYIWFTIGAIGYIYYMIRTENPFAQDFKVIQVAQIGITLFRIYSVANIGENILHKYNELVQQVLRVKRQMTKDEEFEFRQFQTLVINSPIYLSGKHFFIIRTSNLTSIISAILTYVIVFLQFRMSEKTKFHKVGIIDGNFI